jgi:hypothetical protein
MAEALENRMLMATSSLGTEFHRQFHSLRSEHQASVHISGLQTLTSPSSYDPPIANNQTVTTPSGTPVKINLLANDSDPNTGGFLNPASIMIVTPPTHGTLAINTTTGVVTYTPTLKSFVGTDQFTYTVSDNLGQTSNTATVTIQVNAAIAATGVSFAIYPGLPLNTNTVIATFTDTNPDISMSQLSLRP